MNIGNPAFSHADEISLSAWSGGNLFGAIDKNSQKLQHSTTTSGEYEIMYMSGEPIGISVGLARGVKRQGYTQLATASRPNAHFDSNYTYTALRVGAFARTPEGYVAQALFSYGSGSLRFKEQESVLAEKTIDASIAELEARGLFNVFEFKQVKFDIATGLRFYKVLVPGFEYNGISYGKDESSKIRLNILIGLGVRF